MLSEADENEIVMDIIKAHIPPIRPAFQKCVLMKLKRQLNHIDEDLQEGHQIEKMEKRITEDFINAIKECHQQTHP